MGWYDLFATVYDLMIEGVYRSYRPGIVAALELGPGDRVLDLACGTGPNLPLLMEAVGAEGEVFGLEPSEGMIARARKKVGDGAVLIPLMAADPSLVDRVGGPCSLDAIVVTLGLSVIPEPEAVVAALVPLLKPGGRFVAFDIHAPTRVPTSWWVELVARADLSRDPADPLRAAGLVVDRHRLSGWSWIHGGEVFLAVGVKPLALARPADHAP